jgi:hypothetical protein
MNTRLTIVAAIAFAALGYTRAAQAQSLDSWGPSSGASLVQNIPSSDFEGHLLVYAPGVAGIVDNTCNYHLDMQGDGNLVEYIGPGNSSSNALWASGTQQAGCGGAPCQYAIFQSDGNFVIYGPAGVVYRGSKSDGLGNPLPSGTNGNSDWLFINNTGQIIIGDNGGTLWKSTNLDYVLPTVSPCNIPNGAWAAFNNAHNSGTQMGGEINIANSAYGDSGPACATICADTSGCVGYNYNSADGNCQLLSSNGPFAQWSGMESGFREAAEN